MNLLIFGVALFFVGIYFLNLMSGFYDGYIRHIVCVELSRDKDLSENERVRFARYSEGTEKDFLAYIPSLIAGVSLLTAGILVVTMALVLL